MATLSIEKLLYNLLPIDRSSKLICNCKVYGIG